MAAEMMVAKLVTVTPLKVLISQNKEFVKTTMATLLWMDRTQAQIMINILRLSKRLQIVTKPFF